MAIKTCLKIMDYLGTHLVVISVEKGIRVGNPWDGSDLEGSGLVAFETVVGVVVIVIGVGVDSMVVVGVGVSLMMARSRRK